MMFRITIILFIASWCLGAISWGYGLFEIIGMLRLREWAFRFGPVAIVVETRCEYPLCLSSLLTSETQHVKYRVVEGNRCLFRRKFNFFEFRWNTPMEIKGIISWSDGILNVKGRYLLGVILFFVCWLAGWTLGGLLFIIKEPILGALFLGFGWLICGGIYIFSRTMELRRFANFVKEVETDLGMNLTK
jgi:hypothetical protein